MFGRVKVEAQALWAQGNAFEVTGVTEASGCSAAVGIPLTHRNLAGSCVFLPSDLANDDATHDCLALAQPGQKRVF